MHLQYFFHPFYKAKKILALIATILLIYGCKQKTSAPASPKISTEKNNFFPVTLYLLGQINELDSLPVTPLKIITINNKVDSQWIKKEDLQLFILPFVNTVIDSARLNKYFSEKSFLDQTINAFTFTYDPIDTLPDSINVKRWVVYIDPDTHKVKRIYIEKQSGGAFNTTMHLTWKSDYYCQITTIIEDKVAAPEIKEEKVIWNFND